MVELISIKGAETLVDITELYVIDASINTIKETFVNKGRTNSITEGSSTHEETIAALKNQF